MNIFKKDDLYLNNYERQTFLESFNNKKYKRNQIISKRKDNEYCIYYLNKGSVLQNYKQPNIYIHSKTNPENQLLSRYIPEQSFFNLELFFNRDNQENYNNLQENLSTYITRNPCELLYLKENEFFYLLEHSFKEIRDKIIHTFLNELSKNYYLGVNQSLDLAYNSIEGRVVNMIEYLSGLPQALNHPDGIMIKISRIELSKLTGCSRENVGKTLKKLEHDNLIKSFGKTIILIK